MFILAMLFDVTNKSLLFGFVPESLGLLVFGVGLIVLAVGLRWFFNRSEEMNKEELHISRQVNFK